MTDRNKLRRLAEAATPGPWWTSDKLKCHPDLELSDDTAYIAAASPDVVLGLLDEIEELADAYECLNDSVKSQAWDDRVKLADAIAERDELREEAKHALVIVGNVGRELGQTQHERDQLRAVLGKIAEFDPAVTHGWAECVREMARSALKAR